MKIKAKLFRSMILVLCLAMLFVTGCSNDSSTSTGTDVSSDKKIDTFTAGTEFVFSGTQDGLSVVADNVNYTLLMDEKTATLMVKNKKSGYMWKTNLTEEDFAKYPDIDNSIKSEYMSQLNLTYYDGSGKEVRYNSYEFAVASNEDFNKTLAFYKLPNGKDGIRIVYKIGQNIDDAYFPAALTVDTYNQLYSAMDDEGKEQLILFFGDEYSILKYDEMDDTQKTAFSATYKNLDKIDIYRAYDGVAKNEKTNFVNTYLKPIVSKITSLDVEQWLMEEYEKIGYNYTFPDVPMFVVPLNYELTTEGLSVSLPSKEIQFEKSFRLYSIKVLPFFGTVTNGSAGEMFIPDGSGALVDINRFSEESISLPFYGQDYSLRTKDYAQNMQQAVIPSYGLYVNDSTLGKNGFVAHVVKGEGQGSVECHPKTSIYPYSYLGPTFEIHPYETFKSEGAAKAAELQKYSNKRFFGDILLNYYFLNGEESNYVGMAKKIRSVYFAGKEKLASDKTEFYFETYGEILRQETMIGYAYNAKTPMTTVTQAEEIYNKLKNGGIKNISLKYTNWCFDEYNNSINKTGKLSKELGNGSELAKLAELVEADGGNFYPNVELVLDKKSGDLSSALWHVKMIEGTLATYAGRSSIFQEGVTVPVERTIIKTDEILSKVNDIVKKIDKYGVDSYSLSTIGSTLFADYTSSSLKHRDEAKVAYVEILSKVTDGGSKALMVEMGNAYTYDFADDITDISLGNSSLLFEAESIPFVQMVIHGYISYSGSALNLSDNKSMTLLKSIEYGANPYYVLNYAAPQTVKSSNYSTLFSSNYERWSDIACEDYKMISQALDGLQSACISDHQKIAKDVYMTTYENGTSVIVNYNGVEYDYNGTKVPAKNFAVVK